MRPHDEARRLIEHFDVAIIPHLDDDMTRAMNPLKAFVYAGVGVPVVSTPIANLGDLGSVITIAIEPDFDFEVRQGRNGWMIARLRKDGTFDSWVEE